MTQSRHYAAIAALLILSLVGCTTSQVVSDLQIALDAITVALPILGTLTGVPADVSTAVTNYATAANQALGQAATILDGPGTDAEKAAAIAAAFAGIAAPVVPAQYAALAQLVGTIAAEVAAFLGSVPGLGTAQERASAAKSPHTTKWSLDERIKLSRAHSVAQDNAAKLAKIKR
jgi:hypothetical protein